MNRLASLTPGTRRDRLWLLPSGPDQVHQTAMRGGPPVPIMPQRNNAHRQLFASLKSGAARGVKGTLFHRILLHRGVLRAMVSTPSERKPPGVFFCDAAVLPRDARDAWGGGGESGIRTHGTRLTYTRFPSVRLKPLGHLSAGWRFYPAKKQKARRWRAFRCASRATASRGCRCGCRGPSFP